VEWLNNENGISFQDLGIIYGPTENNDSDQNPLLAKDKSVSIEIWLTPGSYFHRSFSNIFSLYDDNQPEIFSFRQVRSSLNISKYQTLGKRGATHSWRWLGNFFFSGQRRLLTITSDKESTTVYFDGRKVKKFRNYSLMLGKKQASPSRIVIGNDPSGTQPWRGKIHGLAIYNHELYPERVFEHFEKWKNGSALPLSREKDIVVFYPMDEKNGQKIHNAASNHYHLSIPIRFKILKKNYLKLSRNALKLEGLSLRDMYINILGFIPLGYLLVVNISSFMSSRASTWRLIFWAILGGTLISLFIEILQAFLPTRNSSLTDLIFNALGTGLGLILALIFIKIKNPAHRSRQSES
jgi:VanZ family protein